mgnify:CR=1 FL=1
MKSITNLSGNPFRNRRLFWLAMLAIFVVATYAGLSAIESRTSAEREMTGYTSEIRMLETQLKKLEKPVRTTQAISLDENRELVAASDLIARRAFSWTQLLNDIERNLPPTVRVLRVAVSQITAEERDEMVGGGRMGAAELTLDVIGKTSLDVTSMINRFHESNRFKVSPVSKKSVEGTEEVEFSLKVEYFPPSSRPEPGSQVASAEVKR